MSMDISLPTFDEYRDQIKRLHRSLNDWDQVANWKGANQDQWLQTLTSEMGFESLGPTTEERTGNWGRLVELTREAIERQVAATKPPVVVGREETEPGIYTPDDTKSCWMLYRDRLIAKDFSEEAIASIEVSSLKILRRLRKSTTGRAPIRGLVVGHVQSGKTGSMAGLSAMAADWGWNLVIVLSGTLENLRQQTKSRLLKDLRSGNLTWSCPVEHPSKDTPTGQRAQDLHFNSGSRNRYLMVVLKNVIRLDGLIQWLCRDRHSLSQMRILIIDDEADQGGINTANISKDERTKINEHILKLACIEAASVNYVAYTATPVANFLNEGPDKSLPDGTTKRTLYPMDFIVALPHSNEHFGPMEIFGSPELGKEGLPITRPVEDKDLQGVQALHLDKNAPLPGSLQDSIRWFLCCAAAMRTYGFKEPVSMLVHTSQRQTHHDNVAAGIQKFLTENGRDLKACCSVWGKGIHEMSKNGFRNAFSAYGRLDEQIPDYPSFEEIQEQISMLLEEISPIRLDGGGENTYHKGIHLCIDNCSHNKVNDENERLRLIYPPDDPEGSPPPLDYSAAFIVVGGGTLARGLTLKNLVSTYFLRASAQADSLMQMGRWFGYRKNYELLPRIWMPTDTRRKFEFMSAAEEDLRSDLKRFEDLLEDPARFGPRVRVHPVASWLKPTSKNKMQEIEPAEYDYSGLNRQTTIFHDGPNSAEIHLSNLRYANEFLEGLERTEDEGHRNSIVFRRVPFAPVGQFLSKLKFSDRAQFFPNLQPFIEWCQQEEGESGFPYWNVVVAGRKEPLPRSIPWVMPGGGIIQKVRRTKLRNRCDANSVSIGALRAPRDLYADLPMGCTLPDSVEDKEVTKAREASGLGNVPQIILYLIDKDSSLTDAQLKIPDKDRDRDPLGADADILGISLWLPGIRKRGTSHIHTVTVRIPPVLTQEADDLPETFENEEGN